MKMKKKQLELIATAALLIIFIFAFVNAFKKIKPKAKPAPVAAVSILVAPVILPQQQAQAAQEELTWRRCPFSGKIYATLSGAARVGLKLSGILWDESKPQALINNSIVQEGESVGGYKIIRIEKERVVVTDGARDFNLIIGQ